MSPYMPTNCEPSVFQDSNWLRCVSGNGCSTTSFLMSQSRQAPVPLAAGAGDQLGPSGVSAWQPTQVVPSVLAGVR